MESINTPIIVIAGLGSSLGLELARGLGREGYRIAIMGRNINVINEAVKTLSEENITAYAVRADLSDRESIANAFAGLDLLNFPICGLIYNAVARRSKTPSELTEEDIRHDLNVNLLGAVNCASETRRRIGYKRGFIIFTGGGVALTPSLSDASMSLGKAALRNYALNLAQELNSGNIFVGTVTVTKKMDCTPEYSSKFIADSFIEMINNRTKSEIVL